MKKTLPPMLTALALSLGLGSSLTASAAPNASASESKTIEVYKNPNCGCCGKWVQHLQDAGFTVHTHETDADAMRAKLGVPAQYASCHTAKVGGYVIEGHVPAADIKRLLKEKPQAIGLAVPGMPAGTPGMDAPSATRYDTLLIGRNGEHSVYASH
ncbi:MAG TPA: DUF411 domain-containing protein [Rhodocyclaceae bacterium]|nr:DUF411 domain-containing protein [Rhodocyclaceae bacterium]